MVKKGLELEGREEGSERKGQGGRSKARDRNWMDFGSRRL